MIKNYFYESAEVKKDFIEQNKEKLIKIINLIKETLEKGK